MSQYREDNSGQVSGDLKTHGELTPRISQSLTHLESSSKIESRDLSPHLSHSYIAPEHHDYSEDSGAKISSTEYSSKSTEFSPGKQIILENSTSKPEFSSSKQLEPYLVKHLPSEQDRINQNDYEEHLVSSKVESRVSHTAPNVVPYHGHPRFLSSQTAQQSSGPTPTLNQLLQATSPVNRFHSNYPSPVNESYQQTWPVQRSPTMHSGYPQTTPRSSQVISPRSQGNNGPSSPTAMTYSSYNQRFSAPNRPHSPYHQLNSYGLQSAHATNIYSEQRGWNASPANLVTSSSTSQTSSSSQSPQRSLSQSPAPVPVASPQPGSQTQDLSGQNSNDSSNGPTGPGTPNSQSMRPTPSPTGSTGSRSLSPAVGQQSLPVPTRPPSRQSEAGCSRICLSPLNSQGAAHYKTNSGSQSTVSVTSGQSAINNSVSSGGGFPCTSSVTQTSAYSFPSYSAQRSFLQAYPTSTSSSSSLSGSYQTQRSSNVASHASFSKINYSNIQPCTLSGNSVMNVGQAACGNMGPPSASMGPPPSSPNHLNPSSSITCSPNVSSSGITSVVTNFDDVPMPPPNINVNVSSSGNTSYCTETVVECPISASASTVVPVTSVVTTGPDGAVLDEASQQSTLSNNSAVSGEDTYCSKVRKETNSNYQSHGSAPQNNNSPGALSVSSTPDDYSDLSNPNWPRTSSSPVFVGHAPQELFRSKKYDGLAKLYDMDDSIERRAWLDKLVSFMEERRTPITSCPTISKNPLDLFRLYQYVKERGGFMEVCKVTKNKTWKDVAGLLGIGASSSAAYTLRKHYTKHLLAYECHFDRGGIDPQPIINQLEAGSKKKASKAGISVPSPGSSNSQDSYPPCSSVSAPLDSYSNYQTSYANNPATVGTAEYIAASQRTVTQTVASQQGVLPSSYQSGSSFQMYSQEQNPRSQTTNLSQQSDFQAYSARAHYSSFASEGDRNFSSSTPPQTAPDAYRFNNQQSVYPSNINSSGRHAGFTNAPQGQYANSQQSGNTQPPLNQSSTNAFSNAQDYYRQEQVNFGSTSQIYQTSGSGNKNMLPPVTVTQQQRRHPDFSKEQQYSPYSQQRPSYTGWSSSGNQFSNTSATNRMHFSCYQSLPTSQHQPPQSNHIAITQVAASHGSVSSVQSWSNQQNTRMHLQISTTTQGQSWEPRYNHSQSFYSTATAAQHHLAIATSISQHNAIKRDIAFPPDTVEAVTPVLSKRRKLSKCDIAPLESWRIMMALRSGLLAESCWALDILNILLYDDTSIHFFGLLNLPGLLDTLLEHFSVSLSNMFKNSIIKDCELVNQTINSFDVDLGAVSKPINPEDRIKLLTCSNYTFLSRRGKPVKMLPKDDEIFILDEKRCWDTATIETEIEPWAINENTVDYMVTYLNSEIGGTSFTKQLRDERPPLLQKEENIFSSFSEHDEEIFSATPCVDQLMDNVSLDSCQNNKISRKKRKSKNLNDVLSRIKENPQKNIDKEKVSDTGNIFKSLHVRDIPLCSDDIGTEEEVDELKHSSNLLLKNADEGMPCDFQRKMQVHDTENDKTLVADIKKSCLLDSKLNELKLSVIDPASTLKRKHASDYEDESYARDEASLYLISGTQDYIARRCVCLSTILRNLTFVPGNETEFAKNVTFLSILGKLLLFHHDHPVRTPKTRNYDREEDADFQDSCSSLQNEDEWWWEFLYHIRENILVIAANIAGYIELIKHSEEISRPLLDGLLHWAVCPAAHGQDPFPTVGISSVLSPQRLALEALCKLCVTESNVDLVIATPPFSRLQNLCIVLSRLLCRSEEQVLREFGVNLLHFLSAADSSIARTIALQTPSVALLVTFIEQAETSALGVVNQHGLSALRENPESMGTSLDMLRRAAGTLLNLSRHPDNRTLLLQHESRLLALVMSQILDQQVASIVARVLFQCSRTVT